MDDSTRKILEIVTDIQEQVTVGFATVRREMATKEDLEAVRRDLQEQITANTKAIAELSEQLRGVFGYAKEIDSLLSRISVIEKHLGIVM